jgi:hypothetical protein
VRDIQITLGISIVLVVLVVFVFLRNLRSTFIPSVAVPLSLIGTFGVMYLLGYSVDNLSLMALAISTGFDECIARGGVHPHPAYARARGPLVPGICRGAEHSDRHVAAGVADSDTHALRQIPTR